MYRMDSVQICDGSQPWRSVMGAISRSVARERPRGLCEERPVRGWGGCATRGRLGENRGSLGEREREHRERESRGVKCFEK
jgi:hypothetical protein